jgi:hypothetical protein
VNTPARQQAVMVELSDVWSAPTRVDAERHGQQPITDLRFSMPTVASGLEETSGDTQAFFGLRRADGRHRTRVNRIFPSDASCVLPVTARTVDCSNRWAKGRCIFPTSPIHP